MLSEGIQKERQIPCITYLWNPKHGTDDPVYKTETDHSQGEQTCGSQEWGGWAFWVLDANCYSWNGWAMEPHCTVWGILSDWVTLLHSIN